MGIDAFYTISIIMIAKSGVVQESSNKYNTAGLSQVNWYPLVKILAIAM